MNNKILYFTLYLLFYFSISTNVRGEEISLPEFSTGSVGKHVKFFQENDSKLTLAQARSFFINNQVNNGTSNSLSLGIGVAPVWLTFSVNNDSDTPQAYRLSIETPWLDYIDTWLINNENLVRHVQGGDAFPFEKRPMPYRFYAFEHVYSPGITQVYIRIEAKGPMAIPVQFSSIDKAVNRDITNGYQYGALYGFMLALALYNLVLFIFIRQKEYGLYSVYLIGFVLNSLSYTGQIHTLITYDFGPYFQDWLDIFLMITYSVAGLHFARFLLKTNDYAPKLDKFVRLTTLFIPLAMLIGFIFNQLLFSMALAFILNTTFVVLFVAMGIRAIVASVPFASLFLVSSVTAAICITISTLAVAGFLVPYNDYTFKLIEVGMAVEAILLAIILARRFRMAQVEKVIAETYARTDTLTQLNNRRGFNELVLPVWQHITMAKKEVSIMLIDIDYFKKFNDQYGHQTGDDVLKKVAKCIAVNCLNENISARWGGEEFIIFLPETGVAEGALQAERIRSSIEKLDLYVFQIPLKITVSIGVSGTVHNKFMGEYLKDITIEPLINQADRALYVAKQEGKNQVSISN